MANDIILLGKVIFLIFLLNPLVTMTITLATAQEPLISKFDANRDGVLGTILKSAYEGTWTLRISYSLETNEGSYHIYWKAMDAVYFIEPGIGYYFYDAGPSCEKVDRGLQIWERDARRIDQEYGAPAYKQDFVLLRIFGYPKFWESLKAVLGIPFSPENEIVLSSKLIFREKVSYEISSNFAFDVPFLVTSIRTPEFPEGWQGTLKIGEISKLEFILKPEALLNETLLVTGKFLVNIAGKDYAMPVITHGFIGLTLLPDISIPIISEVSPKPVPLIKPMITIGGRTFISGVEAYLISPSFPERKIELKIKTFSSSQLEVEIPKADTLPEGYAILMIMNPDGGGAITEIELRKGIPEGIIDIGGIIGVIAVVVAIMILIIITYVLYRRRERLFHYS